MCGNKCGPLKIKSSVLMGIQIRIKSDGHKPGRQVHFVLLKAFQSALLRKLLNSSIQTAQREKGTHTAQVEGDKQTNRIYQHGHPKSNQRASQQLRNEVRDKEQTQGLL